MLIVTLTGYHLYSKRLFVWLSLVLSLMASFCSVFFPTRCLGWDPGLNWFSFWGFSYLLLHGFLIMTGLKLKGFGDPDWPHFESQRFVFRISLKVNVKAMIRNYYNHIPHSTLNIKRERRTHTKFNQNSPSASNIVQPDQTITTNSTYQHKAFDIYFYLFSIFYYVKHKMKQSRQL